MRHHQDTASDPPQTKDPVPARGTRHIELTQAQRILVGVVVAGAVVIAAIGFAGSYSAVRDLAEQKNFGAFAPFFPIGIDAGIIVLLALDLLLTWLRIPFPLLRQTAWLLTAATIAFNGAAAWPDPLGVGMHGVIPLLFVVAVEAARHAVGRIADITADKHMEGVRISRWLLAFPSTFRLWRRMKLWELRSYDEVIRMEQDRLVYESRLRLQHGRNWRRTAPVESMMPLKLARYGIPLAETVSDVECRELEPEDAPDRPVTVEEEGTGLDAEQYYSMFHQHVELHGQFPSDEQLRDLLTEFYGPAESSDVPLDGEALRRRYLWEQEETADAVTVLAEDAPEPALGEAEEPLRMRAAAADDRSAGGVYARVPDPRAETPKPKKTDFTAMGGEDAVRAAYFSLPEEDQQLSARGLAPTIAEMTGLTPSTVKNYLGRLKTALKRERDASQEANATAETPATSE